MQNYPTTIRPYLAAAVTAGIAWSLGLGGGVVFMAGFLALIISALGEDVGMVVLAVDRLRETVEGLKEDLTMSDIRQTVERIEMNMLPDPIIDDPSRR